MPNYIVLRLTPPAAVDAATFTTYLNGLTVKVYDESFGQPVDGTLIGSAAFVGAPLPPDPATHIAQHSHWDSGLLMFVSDAVATALIQYPPPAHEYVGPDLRIEFDRGAQTLFASRNYYDVQVTNIPGPFPASNTFQSIADGEVSAFVTLPPPTQPFNLPGDGTPPNYDQLLAAIQTVLAQDPGVAVDLSTLTPDQCQHIAREIVFGGQTPLPPPPESMDDMYTDPPNTGTFGDSHEQDRRQFEGQLAGYYGPLDAVASRLTNYVYAVSAAVWCEDQSKAASSALVTFPINPNSPVPPPLTTVPESQVVFTGALGVDIPAAYFYALAFDLSTHITAGDRYSMAIGSGQQSNLDRMTLVLNAGWINLPAALNPAQAARILEALNVPTSNNLPQWNVASASANQVFKVDWVAFPPLATWKTYKEGDDINFWKAEDTGHPGAFLDLVLFALTQGYVIPGHGLLADQIKAHLLGAPLASVAQLANPVNVTPTVWQTFFNNLPGILGGGVTADQVLPTFTLPGSVPARIAAFIRYFQKFFQMGTTAPVLNPANEPDPLRFGIPANDLIAATIAAYPGFAFGIAIVQATLEAAAAAAIPGDASAQAWSVQVIQTLNELFILTTGIGSNALQFSLMEALFARGFTSREDVHDHTFDDFQQALTGTVAYDHALAIQANAGGPAVPTSPVTGPFGPINPGCLTDCIPPDYLSPLGPVAYLSEMLKVSEKSTCDDPFAPPDPGHTSLQAQIDARRGPVETLAITRANLEKQLPLIDMINECLESMAANDNKTGIVYNTSQDKLAGYDLCDDHCECEGQDCACQEEGCGCREKEVTPACHKPNVIFDALPEYSTPSTPVPANTSVTPAVWNKLKSNFSTCALPYNQALDVNRIYLEYLRSCRYEEMRTFRKCITELVLDPANQPADFQTHLWRYPVRIDIAIEYLGISLEEYTTLFNGGLPAACSSDSSLPPNNNPGNPESNNPASPGIAVLSREVAAMVENTPFKLPVFLKLTCLTYCEFFELWKSGFVSFRNGNNETGDFPECEPCCLDDMWLEFPDEGRNASIGQLVVFVRLWQKLRHHCGAEYGFAQLADICSVLGFPGPDFIRQLAAFQMLRDQFRLKLTGHGAVSPNAKGADRTFLLALWAGPNSKHWQWAVHHLLVGVAFHAECRHHCKHRGPDFIKLLEDNLDPLSKLAGFGAGADSWSTAPTHTLRFAEVLAKIFASRFTIGEVLYLFNADVHLDGEDPFPLQDASEAADSPLGLPDDEDRFSLRALRRKLLDINLEEDDSPCGWHRIEALLTDDFGFASSDVTQLGERFFPHEMEEAGHSVPAAARQFSGSLAGSSAPMWNAAPGGPFHYDAVANKLWAVLPIADEEVLEQFTHVQQLSAAEQKAVQDVYFGPRMALSTFAALFDHFAEVGQRLIEERDPRERWHYFVREVRKSHARCQIIAHHLSEHVEAVTGQEHPEGSREAALVLRSLYADENRAVGSWENDDGHVPAVTWTPPNGGAYAALLGLTGTGVDGEFTVDHGQVAWREIRDGMAAFETEQKRENCPVPTVVPNMALTLQKEQLKYVIVRNGLAMNDVGGHWLGGAQAFTAKWAGVLYVDEAGEYQFQAPFPAEGRSWRVIIKRGQRTWILLRHHWEHEENIHTAPLRLKSGAYDLVVDFVQHGPEYLHEHEVEAERTGFEIRYCGPDTGDVPAPIRHTHLFRVANDGPQPITGLSGVPAQFLANRYASSLRDIRRTYQRAFKALLFSHRLALSAHHRGGEGSELGYMLEQKTNFAGWSYYRSGAAIKTHKADFDFNFLPVGDAYLSPAGDERSHPLPQRTQALFDWWERLFDYSQARAEVEERGKRDLWRLFEEAFAKQPADPTSLLRHMAADARHWAADLRFFQGQASPVYNVTAADLQDDRWTIRAWHADRWLGRLWCHFLPKDITASRPDLWASDDPALALPGEQTGNANLLEFVNDGCLDNGEPRRYADLRKLNDGLRERGRRALIAYLCRTGGIAASASELSELLLLDVQAGRCEKASRIEDAICAVLSFMRRARLGLEAGWIITGAFAHLWDSRFATFHVWQACKRRELYKENWIDWDQFQKARKIEAFGFLEEQLKRATLTIAAPGGVDYWPDDLPPNHPGLCLLQRRDPAEMQILPTSREGLNLLATPERDARPSWITTVPDPAQSTGGGNIPGRVAAGSPAPAPSVPRLPFWMETAIKLGTRFVRVAAAAYPRASTEFEARHKCRPSAPSQSGNTPADKECCVTCCQECGCEHPAHVDEYYFWLVDARYFDPKSEADYSSIFDGQQNEYYDQNQQVATPWHDPAQLDGLLAWPSLPMVRLAWCRVHNGEFEQPRRSDWGVEYDPTAGIPDLTFAGRVADSLYLSVSIPVSSGFRYDMVPDTATDFQSLTIPAVPFGPLPPVPLMAYPYFAYMEPGARLFPWYMYSPAIAVAHALRTHCRFEAALKWYETVYNPWVRDNRWALCDLPQTPVPGTPNIAANEPPAASVPPRTAANCCCDTTVATCSDARHRAMLLHYLDTLFEWGSALLCRKSAESFEQARVVFDAIRRIMGPHPRIVRNPQQVSATVATFQPLMAPVNPRLIALYDRLDDRLALIHQCLTLRRLQEPGRATEAEFWGDDPVRDGWRDPAGKCCDTECTCHVCTPYRFHVRLQKAREIAAQAKELGAALLAAYNAGDAEYLASIRAHHEREIADLNLAVRENAWRDADWQVQALERSKQSLQSSRRYYAQLIANGLNANENTYVDLTNVSVDSRFAANISEGVAEAMDMIPDLFVGTVDFTQIPIGTKLAGLFKTIARISNTVADIANTNGALHLTEAGWDRRLQDWVHQVEVLDIQIEQTELQILGAERRREGVLREINVQQRSMEQAAEILDALRDKFTNHALYLFLQKHTADLHREVYELALEESRQAERLFHFERGHSHGKFIGCESWDNLHEGLLAGERLLLDLTRLEKAYLDRNCREYELTKHISLRHSFPAEYLRLKLTGKCEIEIPEWMFDLDYPGHYMRRIRNVSVTIPCVAGPYNEVHCRLTLLRSGTRVDPDLKVPASRCCDCCREGSGYTLCPHDPRWVGENGAREAIATSSGVNDAGLFEINFRDDQYLPFEYRGAAGRWRIEMPAENNYFDMDSLSDFVLHLNYTAREGGERLRKSAREAAECRLPGSGWCLFDLRHDFSEAWELFDRRTEGSDEKRKHIGLRFHRKMFPFVPGDRELFIETVAVLFDQEETCGCRCPGECPCCTDPSCRHFELELHRRPPESGEEDEKRFLCVRSEDWPGWFYGSVEGLCVGPLHGSKHHEAISLVFPSNVREMKNAFLLCRYSLREKCCGEAGSFPIAREEEKPNERLGGHSKWQLDDAKFSRV
ncbi:MAG: neuraminidase-like domain-containing protein [Terracidiphilus sp.]